MGFLDRFRKPPPQPPPDPAVVPLREAALAGADLVAQRRVLVRALDANGMSSEGVAAAMEHVRTAVVLLEDRDGDRRSRIGGPPQLPPGIDWPRDPDGRPLTFIATIDLGENPPLDPLPERGTLLVFWSERYFELERMDFRVATRVFWVPDRVQPVEARTPEGAAEYDAVPLSGVPMPVLGELEHIEVPERDSDALFAVYDGLSYQYSHQLLGASRDIQGPVLDEIPYWFEQGYEETRRDYTAEELAGEGWMLLAQIDSTGDLMFGDVGSLYLVIPETDLNARRFDRILGIMQCS